MDLTRVLFFFLQLLMIMQVAQHGVAREMNEERWSRNTLDDGDQEINQIHTDQSDFGSNKSNNNNNNNVLRVHSMDMDFHEKTSDHHHHHHTDVHMRSQNSSSPLDPSVLVFFNLEDLKIGKTMLVHFPDRHVSSYNFLPKEAADEIPFSSEQLPALLQSFNFPQGSPQATAMEDTLRECEMKPIRGETKLCATSISSMFDFARRIFGTSSSSTVKIQLLSTIYLTKITAELQKYVVTEVPKEISSPKMIACHTMPYPYGILYCHYQDSESKVYRVQLVSENGGDKIEAIAVCHMDTSQWSRNHVSFRVLGIKPGSQPVCHFFPADNFVLLPPSS